MQPQRQPPPPSSQNQSLQTEMKQKPLRPKSVEQDQQLKTKPVHFKSNMSEMEHSPSSL